MESQESSRKAEFEEVLHKNKMTDNKGYSKQVKNNYNSDERRQNKNSESDTTTDGDEVSEEGEVSEAGTAEEEKSDDNEQIWHVDDQGRRVILEYENYFNWLEEERASLERQVMRRAFRIYVQQQKTSHTFKIV